MHRMVPRASAIRGQPSWRGIRDMHDDAASTPGLYVRRAYQECRAGFAGRDMQVVRAPDASGPEPTRDAVSGRN